MPSFLPTHVTIPPQVIAIVWLTFSAVFMMRARPARAAAADDDDDDAQAMLQPLNSMLNWGVANSDPEELKRVAKMVCLLIRLHVR